MTANASGWGGGGDTCSPDLRRKKYKTSVDRLLKKHYTVEPLLTDTSITRTPFYY